MKKPPIGWLFHWQLCSKDSNAAAAAKLLQKHRSAMFEVEQASPSLRTNKQKTRMLFFCNKPTKLDGFVCQREINQLNFAKCAF